MKIFGGLVSDKKQKVNEEDKKISDLRKTIDMQMELIENQQDQIYRLSVENKKLKRKLEKEK